MSPTTLFLGLIFGCLGTGYWMYGRRQQSFVPLLCGVLLMTIPYFISNIVALVAVGALVAAVPFFVRV